MAPMLFAMLALSVMGVVTQERELCSSTADIDPDGYRLVLRHTSNQMTLHDFFNLYHYGIVSGCLENSLTGSQYKDPYLPFYWSDVTGLRLDSFDIQGEKKTSIYFNVSQAAEGDSVTWSNIFDNRCSLISKNEDKQFYTDISNSCGFIDLCKSEDGCNQKGLIMATSENCDSQMAWFMLQGGQGSGACYWENDIREKTLFDNDYTVAFYNSFPVALQNEMTLKVASKLEIRITGAFVPIATSDTNGFTRVFRYPSYAGVHIMDYFEQGITDNTADRSALTSAYVKTWDMYRSDDLKQQLEGASEILFTVYDWTGHVDQVMTFKGSGDHLGWFHNNNLKSSLNWNMPTDQTFDYFDIAIPRRTKHGRYFIINTYSYVCGTDTGFFLVSCKRDTGETPCKYENMAEDPDNDFLCMIQYTKTGSPVTFDHFQDRKIGSAIEIFVKPSVF